MAVMDPTGGFREISKLRESRSSFIEDLSDEEQPQETSSPLVGHPPKLRRPRTRYPWKPTFLTTINKSQVNRRLRLLFRIVSMIASGTILGSLGSVLYIYETTKDQKSHHEGGLIWPMGVDYLATRVQLAAAVLTFATDLGFFVASYKIAVRRLDTALLKTFALVTTSACIGVLAAAIGTYEVAEASARPTLMWTCTAKTLHWDEAMTVDFPFLCGEMIASRWMMIGALVFQALILATILVDVFYRGDKPKKPKVVVGEGYKAITGWRKVLDRVGL